MAFVPTTKQQVENWLERHGLEEPKKLAEWKLSTEVWSGWELRFFQLLVHETVGSENVTLRSSYQSALKEVDRRGGIRGDWAVRYKDSPFMEVTLILVDGSVARVVLLKEGKMLSKITALVRAQCVKRQYRSYPNGSSYNEDTLRSSERFQVVTVYNAGYAIITDKETGLKYTVSNRRVSVGAGADFGVHFCTRDQVFAAFQPGGEGLRLDKR